MNVAPAVVALRAPRRGAAVAGDVVGDPHRQPRPRRHRDQRLGQRPRCRAGGPKMRLMQAGQVHGRGALAAGRGQRGRGRRRHASRPRAARARRWQHALRSGRGSPRARQPRTRRRSAARARALDRRPALGQRAAPPPRRAACARARGSSLTSLPVSIPTGQASLQVPSAAQVSIAVVLVLARAAPRAPASPSGWRAISRRSTMRWRGVVVRSRLGQTGSQNPHSTQCVGRPPRSAASSSGRCEVDARGRG